MWSTIFLVLTTVAVSVNGACSYPPRHTMCVYTRDGCSITARGVSASQRDVILKTHNSYRSRVATGKETLGRPGPQPKASNMRELVWDPELAKIAQTWANQCKFGHDSNRNTAKFGYVGQNVAWMGSSNRFATADFAAAIKMWYDEVKYFNPRQISPFVFSPGYGHYTQVVWGSVRAVGCGFSTYKKPGDAYYSRLYVCNYGPGGNVQKAAMYTRGTPCSRCKKCSSKYSGLCDPTA